MKKKIIIILITIIVIAAGYYGYNIYSNNNQNENEQQEITENNTREVARGNMKKTISVSGNIYPIEEQVLTFSIDGTVSSVKVSEGDSVNKGDILVELNNNRAQLEYLRAENNYKKVKINGSDNAIKEAELDFKIAKENLEDTKMKAPYSGIITELNAAVGDYIKGGENVITLIDNSSYEVEANIDESELSNLEIGQSVEISMEALPNQKLSGTLTDISSKAVSTSGVITVPITVLMDTVQESFRPGLSADMDIIVEEVENEIIVPITAIINRAGTKYVQKVVDEKIQLTEITTGFTDGLRIVVLSGLGDGDKILVNTAGVANADSTFRPGSGSGAGLMRPGGGN